MRNKKIHMIAEKKQKIFNIKKELIFEEMGWQGKEIHDIPDNFSNLKKQIKYWKYVMDSDFGKKIIV